MPEPMSSAAERVLHTALSDVAGYVNNGLHPDAAIEKAARDRNVPSGHIRLMTNAYNIGRTTRQREDGGSAQEKAAEFPLACAANVLERLYPTQVKAANQIYRERGVSSEYSHPPRFYTRPHELAAAATVFQKAAEAAPLRLIETKGPVGTPEWRYKHAQSNCDRRNRAVDAARSTVTGLHNQLQTKLAALDTYFATPGNFAVADVHRNVEIMYGDVGTQLLDRVPASRTKTASVRRHMVTPTLEPYRTITEIVKLAEEAQTARKTRDAMRADAQEKNAVELAPFALTPKPTSVLDQLEKSATFGNIQGGIGYALGEGAIQRMGAGLVPPDDDERLAAKTMSRIATPEHEQALAAIEARAHFRELFDDEVLRGHDPHDVASHYNRISQFAPSVARKPLMAIPLVRKSVQQGQLDTFDASGVADAEQKLRAMNGHGAQAPVKKGALRASSSVLD